MDPSKNPYAPGAGLPPPALAGRDHVIANAQVALKRLATGKTSRSIVLYGLRGVGKTVLLRKCEDLAAEQGCITKWIEAPEDRSRPSILAPALRTILLQVAGAQLTTLVAKAMGALAGFVSVMRLKYEDVELSIDAKALLGTADSGNLESDLTELIQAVGDAAKDKGKAVVLFIDELQYVEEIQLAALISALHAANQRLLPIAVYAAGLPQILGQSGRAKSYAERLFEYVEVDALGDQEAREALCKPAGKEGVTFSDEAIDHIVKRT